jgi:hypothetical protein
MPALTHTRLLERVTYDPITGAFHKNGKYWGRCKSGQRVGYKNRCSGRWVIRLDGQRYHASRLAWFYMTGRWPPDDIDHINRDCADDRFVNLREATRSQNIVNKSFQSRNTSGFRGVIKRGDRWIAQVTKMGDKKYLGTFDTPEKAYEAYVRAAKAIHGEFLP